MVDTGDTQSTTDARQRHGYGISSVQVRKKLKFNCEIKLFKANSKIDIFLKYHNNSKLFSYPPTLKCMPTVFHTRLFGIKLPDYTPNKRLIGTSWLNLQNFLFFKCLRSCNNHLAQKRAIFRFSFGHFRFVFQILAIMMSST